MVSKESSNRQEKIDLLIAKRNRLYRKIIMSIVCLFFVFITALLVIGKFFTPQSTIAQGIEEGRQNTKVNQELKYEAKEGEFQFLWDYSSIEEMDLDQVILISEIIDTYGKPSSVEYYNDTEQYVFQYDKSEDSNYDSHSEIVQRQHVRIGFKSLGSGLYYVVSINSDYLAYKNISNYQVPTQEQYDSFQVGETTIQNLLDSCGYPSGFNKSSENLLYSYVNLSNSDQFVFIFVKDSEGNYYLSDKTAYLQ